MVGFTTGFGTAPPATGGSEAGPRGEGDIYRHFGTATLPTGASVASSRGKGGFWTVFGKATPSTGASEPSQCGEPPADRSKPGNLLMLWPVFGRDL